MTTLNEVRKLIRDELSRNDTDSDLEIIAQAVADELVGQDLTDVLPELLVPFVSKENRSVRSRVLYQEPVTPVEIRKSGKQAAQTQRAKARAASKLKRITEEAAIYRQRCQTANGLKFLRDMTILDVKFNIDENGVREEAFRQRRESWERMFKLMQETGVSTIGDLSTTEISSALRGVSIEADTLAA